MGSALPHLLEIGEGAIAVLTFDLGFLDAKKSQFFEFQSLKRFLTKHCVLRLMQKKNIKCSKLLIEGS